MLAVQALQENLDGMKSISKNDYYIADSRGIVLAATGEAVFDGQGLRVFLDSQADSQVVGEYYYFKVHNEEYQPEYVLIVGGGTDPYMLGQLAVFQLQNLLKASQERFDKDSFYKNLLLDNFLLVDVFNRAKKLHIEMKIRRVVFVVECGKSREAGALEQLRTVLQGKKGDFVTAVDENSMIVVRELEEQETPQDIQRTAQMILDYVCRDENDGVRIAYGTIVKELQEVSRSYKEARLALDIGRIFLDDRRVMAYSSLGIGRLIYQLPIPLCKMFIREVFGEHTPEDQDEETLLTINKFFEYNLNVSETSRQLFIHRNTLVYRLDKLQKTTGLDLRVFEDAITFKIALMVVKYMKYMETIEY